MGITPDQMQEISEAFSLFDSDEDNQLNPSEFEIALLVLGLDIKLKDYRELLKGINLDSTEKIWFRDFFGIAKILLESQDPFTRSVRAFKSFDEEYSGKISFRELRKVTRELGENLSDDELHVMIDVFDRDGDRNTCLEEFLSILE